MFEDSFEEHLLALTQAKKEESSKDAPFDSQRNAAASWVDANAGTCLDDTMARIMKGTPNARGIIMRPNAQQEQFLKHFIRRLKVEVLEIQQQNVNQNIEEPLLDLIHGFPGTGKSEVIAWMR